MIAKRWRPLHDCGQLRPTGDPANKLAGFDRCHPDSTDAGEGFPEFLAQCSHPGERAGDYKRMDALPGVRHFQSGGLLLKNDAVGTMLAEETHVDPQGAAAVVAVGDPHEGCEGFGGAAVAHQIHGVRLVSGPDDTHDVARIRRDQGFLVRHPHIPRHSFMGDGDKDGLLRWGKTSRLAVNFVSWQRHFSRRGGTNTGPK